MKFSAAIAFSFMLSGSAVAFEVDGIRSGMTVSQLESVAKSRNLEVWQFGDSTWAMGRSKDFLITGTYSFCGSAGLFWYSRAIDVDADYFGYVERAVANHGQPVVSTTRDALAPGGDVVGLQLKWKLGNTLMSISSHPQSLDGNGKVRHNRAAFVRFADDSRGCPVR